MCHDLFDVIAGVEAVLVAECYGPAELGAVHQARGCLENSDAGALRADQGAGDVVARASARYLWVAFPDQVGVLVPEIPQLPVDLASPAALFYDLFELLLARLSHPHARTVVEQYLHLVDVGYGLASHHRVGSAGVIADHAAQGAEGVGGGVGSEG